jgi:hypothetical protein
MKILSSLLCAAAALSIVGCSSSNNPVSPDSTSSDSYFPVSKGSTWTYAGSVNYTYTAGNDTTVNGKQYTTLVSSLSTATGMYRRDGNSYYSYDPSTSTETLFLKDGDVNSTWSFDNSASNGTQNHHEYTIVEKGIKHTVNGKEYSNVLHVHSVDSFQNPITGDPIVFAEGHYYYAKGIGLIQTDLGTLGVVNLISYSIK